MRNDFESNYLAHNGILGQKWGVRNGPPYPLARNAHSKSEIEAGYKKSIKSKNADKDTSITEGHYVDIEAKYGAPRQWYGGLGTAHDDEWIEVEERQMPDGRYIYPPVAKVIKDFEDAGLSNPYKREKGFDNVYDEVNPNYGSVGTTNNCPYVGAAVEIRARGYDIVARRSKGGVAASAFVDWFKGAKNEECDTFDELKQDIKAYGDGASGVFQGYYGGGLGSGCGGHTLHWRNEKGKTIVADGQIHREYDSWDDVMNTYNFNPGKCFNTRLDNCEPNWDNLARDGVIGVNNSGRKYRNKTTGKVVNNW